MRLGSRILDRTHIERKGKNMKQFVVEQAFWDLFPQAVIGVIVCNGIDNTPRNEDMYRQMLRDAEEKAMSYLTCDELSSNAVIRVWRDAFQMFKTKKGARSSIEALLKRVSKGNHLDPINPLVDLYNTISLRYALPCGGEDIERFAGDLRLTLADGDEPFVTLGSEKSEPPYPRELVYKDEEGAVCRCWNWRESVRTMLTEETQHAFMCMECVDPSRIGDLKQAIEELARLIEEHLNGACRIEWIDHEHPTTVLTK